MEESILDSTKSILGLAAAYDVFDEQIIDFINGAFSNLNQLGVGPIEGFMIDDAMAVWSDYVVPLNQLGMVKTYIYLKTRILFDPPTPGYVHAALLEQIREHEWRLSSFREVALQESLEG